MRKLVLFFALAALSICAPLAMPASAVSDHAVQLAEPCPFSPGFNIGYVGKRVASCIAPPTASPSPNNGCAAIPTLIPGQEWATSFAPFCQSPWTTPISANCQVGNCTASWSSTVIANEWANGNTCGGYCSVTANVGTGAWGNTNVYYAAPSDPQIKTACTQYCGTGSEAAPSQITIPAVARGPLGCAAVTTDQPMQIVEPNGDVIEFGYVGGTGGCGSGTGGNWQTGDTLTAGAAGKCGNLAQPAIGFFQTNPVASASGHCFIAGALRANELAAGSINHALYLTMTCGGSPGGTSWQYPAMPTAQTQYCTNGGATGGAFGPPLGGRLWYDVPCSTINTLALTISEKAILCALHTYGAYFTDDIGGGAVATGFGEFGAESGYMFFQYGVTSPFASLSDWTGYSCTTSGSGTCYTMTSHQTAGSEWNPFTTGTGGVLDPLVHMHWLNPCSAQGTC